MPGDTGGHGHAPYHVPYFVAAYVSYRMLRRAAEAGSISVLAVALAVMYLSMLPLLTWQTAGSGPTIRNRSPWTILI